MRIQDLPVIGPLFAAGADDPVFDSLLLLGPIAILGIAMFGQTLGTVTVAVTYIGCILGYIVYKGHR